MQRRANAGIWLVALTAVGLLAAPFGVRAEHWMGSYHWPQGPTVQLAVGDNVAAGWEDDLDGAVMDWSVPVDLTAPDVIDLTVVPGGTSAKACKPTAGRVEVCAAAYGETGWLGMAQLWAANHDNHVHITQAIVRANDTYFNTPYYDTAEWRGTVMCHEIGHTLGLGHRDEDFSTSVGSCMDYADPPTPVPDLHDYEELEFVYTVFFGPPYDHPTTSSTGGGGGGGGRGRGNAQVAPGDAGNWGRLVSGQWNESIFEADLGFGQRLVTFVIWAN